MARKNQKKSKAKKKYSGPSHTASQPAAASTNPLASVSRRTWLLTAVGAIAATGGASALHAWDVRTKERHDLGVIGSGLPVVVQIHDRNCPTCRRLKASMHSALEDRTDIHYRIADIDKDDGREIQQRFNVPNVTLLFFDGEGEHLHSHTGLLDAEGVTEMVDEVINQLAALQS